MGALYFAFAFYHTTTDANAKVPALEKKAIETDKKLELIDQKVDLNNRQLELVINLLKKR